MKNPISVISTCTEYPTDPFHPLLPFICISARISTCLTRVILSRMEAHQMKLNPKCILMTRYCDLPGQLSNHTIWQCNLGVVLDNQLSFFPHTAKPQSP